MPAVKSSVAVAFLSVVLGAFGLLSAAWMFISVSRTAYLTAIVALGGAVFSFGMVAMLLTVASRRVVPRAESDDDGVTFRPDRRVDTLLVVSSLAGFLAMALYAIFAPLGMLDIRGPRGNGQFIVIATAAGALVGVFALRHMLVQRGSSILRMTVAGLETGNTMTTVRRSWDEVTDIADRPTNGRHGTGAAYIATADGHVRAHPTDWYTPGGQALRELMRFYWGHPERRSELADGTALKRLQGD